MKKNIVALAIIVALEILAALAIIMALAIIAAIPPAALAQTHEIDGRYSWERPVQPPDPYMQQRIDELEAEQRALRLEQFLDAAGDPLPDGLRQINPYDLNRSHDRR
jgi:hypothetical protein